MNDKETKWYKKLADKILPNKIPSYLFIILGLFSIIIYLLIPENHSSEWVQIVRNLFNPLGSILIVGGIFEIAFKEKFIKEVSENFVKTIFLEPNNLNNFKEEDLEQMHSSIQNKLLENNRNSICSQKIVTMINDSFYQMAKGTHNKNIFNTFFQSYISSIYVKKRENMNDDKVTIEYEMKYELINNKKNGEEVKVDIFAKRFFPLILSSQNTFKTQELNLLTIKKDDESIIDYSQDIKNSQFEEITLNKDDFDNITIQEQVKRQIQYKKDGNDEFKPLEVSFKNRLIVHKKIKISTLHDDIHYSHIFNRPTLNYTIRYLDENVSTDTKDYLTLRLFSGLNKKSSDKIHPTLAGNSISLSVSEGILLPGEGISIVALRN